MADGKPETRTSNGNGDASAPQSRQRSSRYPRYTLRQAEEFAKVAFDIGPRMCDQDRVAQKAGYTATSGSYKSLRASAVYFGMVETDARGDLSVTDEWIGVFHSEDPAALKRARQTAMYRPPLYRQLLEEYAGRMLPEAKRLARELHMIPRYGIVKEVADTAAKTFLESVSYAGLVDERGRVRPVDQTDQTSAEPLEKESAAEVDWQQPQPTASVQPMQHSYVTVGQDDTTQTVSIPKDLDRYEINLRGGKKAFLFVPPLLSERDKVRLKGYIDLIDDEDESFAEPQPMNTRQSGQSATQQVEDDDTHLWT